MAKFNIGIPALRGIHGYLFIIIMMLASCRIQRKIYSPLPVNNPSLQKKNDFSINATISDPLGFDINSGFAITSNWALIAGAYLHKTNETQVSWFSNSYHDSSNLIYRHHGFTLGTGIFFPLDQTEVTYLSFFAGMNKGMFRMNEDLYQFLPTNSHAINNYKSDLNRYFVQGSLNFYGKRFEGSVSTRLSFVKYQNVITDYSDTELADYFLPPFVSRPVNSFLDASVDLKFYFSQNPRWGVNSFGLLGSRVNNDDAPNNKFYYYYPFRIGVGIFFRGFTGNNKSK